MGTIRLIWCCMCARHVQARLTDGSEVYPNSPRLSNMPFWKCDDCGQHVGCHHKTKNRTRPLGCIPSPAIRGARKYIHELMDPLWKNKGRFSRNEIYKRLSETIGREYHTAEIRSLDEARTVWRTLKTMSEE